jgi:short-subunit dehydrogenase
MPQRGEKMEQKARTALVTGASSGIGVEFARVFAANGYNLVITARRKDRLDRLALELADAHDATVTVIIADLSMPESPAKLWAEICNAGIQIDVLVNNAGYGMPGIYKNTAWEEHKAFIQVMITSPAELCHLVEPGMRERGWGRIINVASLAGFMPPSAGHTLYNAAKAFLIKFSQSYAEELRGTGVCVTALCPGFTYSEFHDVNDTRQMVSKLPSCVWMKAATVARQGYMASMRGDVVYINGGINRLLAGLAKYIPEPIARRLTQSQSNRFRKA